MTFMVAYIDDDETLETIIREFSDRDSMIKFCVWLKKNNIQILCVWSEGNN